MYSNKPNFIYGFHGLDRDIAIKILNQQEDFHQSDNSYDCLGKGTYFWENNYERAKQYAEVDSKRRDSKIKTPFVLGAVLDLGNCFDLLDQRHLDFLLFAYQELEKSLKQENKTLPENLSFGTNDFDFKKRVGLCSNTLCSSIS